MTNEGGGGLRVFHPAAPRRKTNGSSREGHRIINSHSRIPTNQRTTNYQTNEQTKGPTYARARSESLYDGETYVMGIDSHTNFAEGWDSIMIDMFKRIRNPRAIITAYPHAYPNSQQEEGGDGAVVETAPKRMTSICRTRRVKVRHEGVGVGGNKGQTTSLVSWLVRR